MTNEENRYGYDELRWLAQDTHKRRRHAIWWTGGLVLGSMALATAYVSRDSDRGNTPPGPIAVELELGDVPDSLKNINENLADLVTALKAQDPVSLTFATDGVRPPSPPVAPADSSIYVNRVIWLVEGSRQFPMAKNDILWIPEADRWLKLNTIGTEPAATGPRTEIEIWQPNAPPSTNATRYRLPKSLPAVRNTASCVRISSGGPSKRPGFGSGYVDIDVYFFAGTNAGCPDNP
jgi:hypothetical protein